MGSAHRNRPAHICLPFVFFRRALFHLAAVCSRAHFPLRRTRRRYLETRETWLSLHARARSRARVRVRSVRRRSTWSPDVTNGWQRSRASINILTRVKPTNEQTEERRSESIPDDPGTRGRGRERETMKFIQI